MSNRPSDKAIAQAFWETDALEPEFHPGALYTDYVVRRAREIDAAKTVADTQWVMVPREPTEEMLHSMDKGSAYQTWKNMIEAAIRDQLRGEG